jgi:hypothetical protein
MFGELTESERADRLQDLGALYSETFARPVVLVFDDEEAERLRLRIRCRLLDLHPERAMALAAAVNRANFGIFAGKLLVEPGDGVYFELAVPDESLTEESLPVKLVLAARVADANVSVLQEAVS